MSAGANPITGTSSKNITRQRPGVMVNRLEKCSRSMVSGNIMGFMGVSVSIASLKAPSKKSFSGLSSRILNVPSGNRKIDTPRLSAVFSSRKLCARVSGLRRSTKITAARYIHPKMGILLLSYFHKMRIGWGAINTIGGMSI